MNKNNCTKKQHEPNLNFRNTRSKFYKKNSTSVDDFNQQNQKEDPQKSTGNYWKQQGNAQYKKGNMEKAIQHYTKAIQKTSSQSVYYCNRARCFKSLGKFRQALKDAQQACELDPENIKANYICGCLLAQLCKEDPSKFTKAQNRLKKALRLCSTFKKNQFQDEISIKYYRLKKLHWYLQRNEQLEDLIVEKKLLNDNKNVDHRILVRIDKRIKELNQIKEIPDYLCCKITLDLMEEPVTTEQGLTYQKSALEDHFKTNGFSQPISRKKLSFKPFPNQAIKNAIQDFLQNNPWAFQHGLTQNYFQIEF